MPAPDSLPSPDSIGPGGGFFPELPRVVGGAVLTAILTIGGLAVLGPKFGQGTGPRSNTPTGHSAVTVLKKQPQVVLSQTLYDPTAPYPLQYKVEVDARTTEVRIGKSARPTDSTAIKLDADVLIGQRDGDQFPLRLTQPDGGETTLSLAAEQSNSVFAYDIVAGASDFNDPWHVTPVIFWLNNYKGTFYVFSK